MHVISRKPFNDAIKKYPNHRASIENAYKVLRKGTFKNPNKLKSIFPSLDNFKYKKKWWIIDIAGNHLRLMAFIEFKDNRMYVKHIVSHIEYDRLCKQYAKDSE